MATLKSTPAKKASANTEVVLGQAAAQIAKAVNELKAATATVATLSDQSEELTLLVANKEDAISALEVEYAEKRRQADVELELSFKANQERVVNQWLTSNGYTSIATSELTTLRSDLETARTNTEATVKKEVATVAATLKTQYENEIKLIHSENKAIAAENAAKIGTLATQNVFLEEQVTRLYAQLDAERSAGIERAKAGSVGSINVAPSSK
jgi:predicted RNase H-like nuclease (RuvC/YqgF family)